MFTVDWALELLALIVDTFDGIWTWLSSPISETISNSSVIGPIVSLVIPDAIGKLSPVVLMFGVGIFVYLAFQLVAWILSWLPVV